VFCEKESRVTPIRSVASQDCCIGTLTPGEADWGGHFRSRDIATLVAIRRKCTSHMLKLSDTRRRPLAVSERTSKSNLYDNNTRKCQDKGHLSMARSLSI
jgi:hypothetical protein